MRQVNPVSDEASNTELAAIFTRGVEAERARVLAILDLAWKSPKLTAGTRLAMAILARRVRDPDDRSDVAGADPEAR